jgi:hypothetical protein
MYMSNIYIIRRKSNVFGWGHGTIADLQLSIGKIRGKKMSIRGRGENNLPRRIDAIEAPSQKMGCLLCFQNRVDPTEESRD